MSYLDLDLMMRYASGWCSGEEGERFERWLGEDPRNRELYDAVLAAGAGATSGPGFPAAASRAGARAPGRAAHVTRLRAWAPRWMRQSAAAVLLATIGVAAWRTLNEWLPNRAMGHMLRAVATRPGQRVSLDLGGGMRIILGAASTLRYPIVMDRTRRELWLDGEAYFDVAPDTRRPFVVHTAHAVAEDRGTSFVMQAYAADADAQVVVTEGEAGEVVLSTKGNAAGEVVVRGELGRVRRDGGLSLQPVDPAVYLAWTRGRLEFSHATLGGVLSQLQRWYGVAFEVADSSLLRRDVSGAFDGDSLSSAIDELASSAGVRCERRGRMVVVRPIAGAR